MMTRSDDKIYTESLVSNFGESDFGGNYDAYDIDTGNIINTVKMDKYRM